ncbi:hypothetical protein C0J52_25833 [Blattella germanica]|nr:hypothetical protein C0J52_25833 [Blattella germanica]
MVVWHEKVCASGAAILTPKQNKYRVNYCTDTHENIKNNLDFFHREITDFPSFVKKVMLTHCTFAFYDSNEAQLHYLLVTTVIDEYE